MFGAKKMGSTTPSFGGAAKPAGTGATPSFGGAAKPVGTGATPSFGGAAKPAGTGATPSFGGAAKPAGTGATPSFGAAKPAGSTTAAFGAKPAGSVGGVGGVGTTPSSSFGAKPAGTVVGGTTPSSSSSSFGAKPAGSTATTGFGRTAAGFGQTSGAAGVGVGVGVGFGSGSSAASASSASSGDLASLVARITDLGNRLHPTSPYCALKYIFYNRVDPSQVRYFRRPDSFDPSLWAQAQALNPDAEHLVPHQASGYPDLKARLDAQDSETGAQASALADVETFLRVKYEELSLTTALKLDQLKRDSLLLSHRLLTVSSHIEILRARGLAIQPDEDAWRQQLHNILLQLSKPNEYRGRLNELSSRLRMQQHQQFENGFGSTMAIGSNTSADDHVGEGGVAGYSSSSGGGTAAPPAPSSSLSSASQDAFSPSDLEHFTQFLQHQQTGLEHLIDILNADVKNIQTLSESAFLLKRD